MTTPDRDCNISPLTSTTTHIKEKLVRDEQTNELYLPLSSTVVLKRKQDMLCVSLDFDNNLTTDTLVDSRAYVNAIAQTVMNTKKTKGPEQHLQNRRPSQISDTSSKWPLRKTISKSTFKFGIGDITFAEHFVVMKKLWGPLIGLHFMSNNSVIIDTRDGHIHFRHLTVQVKTTSEISAKSQGLLTDDALTKSPRTTKTVTGFVDHPSDWNTTGTVTPLKSLRKLPFCWFLTQCQQSVIGNW